MKREQSKGFVFKHLFVFVSSYPQILGGNSFLSAYFQEGK